MPWTAFERALATLVLDWAPFDGPEETVIFAEFGLTWPAASQMLLDVLDSNITASSMTKTDGDLLRRLGRHRPRLAERAQVGVKPEFRHARY